MTCKQIDEMADEFGAFGVDWHGVSRQLIDSNARSRARSRRPVRRTVSRLRHIGRAIMTQARRAGGTDGTDNSRVGLSGGA